MNPQYRHVIHGPPHHSMALLGSIAITNVYFILILVFHIFIYPYCRVWIGHSFISLFRIYYKCRSKVRKIPITDWLPYLLQFYTSDRFGLESFFVFQYNFPQFQPWFWFKSFNPLPRFESKSGQLRQSKNQFFIKMK